MIKIITYLLKLVLMVAPFFSLILMLGALWGVTGKTTYKDADTLAAQAASVTKASNLMVKETQNAAACAKTIVPESNYNENSDTVIEGKPYQGKIDWDRTV